MDIDRLQKALTIVNKSGKSGNIYAEHDEVFLWPMADSFTEAEVVELETLGFYMNDEGGFTCFT